MARVVFPDNYLRITGGQRELPSEAASYRELFNELTTRWPDLAEILNKAAVAIDGQIYQDPLLEEIGPTSEVFFLERIEGG